MRRFLAGLIVGVGAAAIVLGVVLLSARQSAGGVDPLQSVEFRTYDWRLTRTAEPKTARAGYRARRDRRVSLRNLQPNAGRWPWPRAVHSMLIDYLQRAPAKVIAYDVDFAEADTRTGFEFGGDTWSGKESDKALIDSVRDVRQRDHARRRHLRREAHGRRAALPDAGYRSNSPGIVERQTIFPPFAALADAAAGFGHNLFVLDPDGPMRHTRAVRARRGARAHAVARPGRRASRRRAFAPGDVTLDGHVALQMGDRAMPMSRRRCERRRARTATSGRSIDFRGPALLAT